MCIRDSNLFIRNAAWPPRAQLIVQTRHTLFEKTLSPLAHRDLGPAQALSNLGIALALGRPQHDFGAADERMRQATRCHQTLQLCAFIHAQFEGGFGASGEHSAAYRCLYNIESYLWDTTLGHITKQGSSILRFLLVEAAQVTVRRLPEWRSRYFHLMMRRGRKIAKVAMARRLAVCLYWMLRQGWDYQQWVEFGSHAGQPGNRHGVQ